MSYLILPSRRTRQPVGPARLNAQYAARGVVLLPGADPLSTRYGGITAGPTADVTVAYLGDGSGVKRAVALTTAVNGYPFTGIVRFLARDVATNCGITTIGGVDSAGNNRVQLDVNANTLRFVCAGTAVSISSVSIVADRWYTAVCVGLGTSDHRLYVDGNLVASDTTAVNWRGPWDRVATLGLAYYLSETGSVGVLNGSVSLNVWLQKTSSDAEACALSANPWQLFAPYPRRIYFGAGAGGGTVTGTASITPSPQTITGLGSVAVGATLNKTPNAQTVTTAVAVAVSGTATIMPAAQTVTASGTVVSGVVGTASITPAAQTITASGTIPVAATASITPAAQTLTGSAAVTGGTVTGTASITPAAQTLTGSASVSGGTVTGTASITPSAQTVIAAGNIIVLATANLSPAAQTLTARELSTAPDTVPESSRTWDSEAARIGAATVGTIPARLGMSVSRRRTARLG